MKNKIVIFGGSGQIGRHLCNHFSNINYEIISASRHKHKETHYKQTQVNYDDIRQLAKIMEDTKYIFNFAGTSIAGKRWTKRYKNIIYESRINTTKAISEGILLLKDRPFCFLSASAIGIYGDKGNDIIDENTIPSSDFLSSLCIDWEKQTLPASNKCVRTINLRIGVVLETDKGALKEITRPFKLLIGGKLGTGNQWFSFIHIHDLINSIEFLINNPNISGPVNAVAPNPVTNSELSNIISTKLNKPNIFRTPKFMLRLVLGEFANFLLSSQRVIPKKLNESGYKFKFPTLNDSLSDLLT